MRKLIYLLLLPAALIAETSTFMQLNIQDFDVQGNQVILRGGAEIQYEKNRLHVDDEIQMELDEKDGTRDMRSLVSKGRTEFVRLDSEGNPQFTLLCFGRAQIDKEKGRLLMERLDAEEQVSISDQEGKIYADRVMAKFSIEKGTVQLLGAEMEGNVRVFHRFPSLTQEAGGGNQYALADYLLYEPEKNDITISAVPGERVLLVDKVHHMRMSAPAIRIHQDPATGKESIQGIGDMRIRLKQEEMDRLNLHFGKQEKAK